jgi:hypothetical protein
MYACLNVPIIHAKNVLFVLYIQNMYFCVLYNVLDRIQKRRSIPKFSVTKFVRMTEFAVSENVLLKLFYASCRSNFDIQIKILNNTFSIWSHCI